jgi:tRNA(fMet)-specific endonuclease VapC
MPRYLLDTNIVSALIADPHGQMAQRARRLDVCTSIIVAAELRYGTAKKRSRRLTARVEEALERLDVLPFAAPADES